MLSPYLASLVVLHQQDLLGARPLGDGGIVGFRLRGLLVLRGGGYHSATGAARAFLLVLGRCRRSVNVPTY